MKRVARLILLLVLLGMFATLAVADELWRKSIAMTMIPGVINQGLNKKVDSLNLAGGRLACCPASPTGSCEARASVFL